jgi:hypothetical protein
VWSVLHYDWPANLRELRDYLFARYPKERLARRGLEAVLYRMGIDPTAITETRPVVEAGSLVIRDADGADGPYSGAVQLWCRVSDPDDQYGESDMATMKVRFEYRFQSVDALSAWVPIDCALTPAASPPPGHSGSGWFQVAWDTRAPSPVLLIPDAEIELNTGLPKVYDYTPNTSRGAPMITAATTLGGSAKRDTNWVRAIAFDGLAESEPLESGAFAIDNSPSSFDQQGRADATADYIYWDDDHVPAGDINTITWKPFTYELFFTPSAAQAGRVFEYSLGYKNVDAGRGEHCEIMWLQMLGDGRLWFVVNEGGNKPGNGTWHYVYSTTALQAGTRYHIAAQSGGPGGMKLFVNGHAEYGAGSNGAGYAACPEADESDGTLYGGWFAVGVYSDFTAGKYSALGGYDEVRVSNTERYTVDFTPRTTPFTSDANKVLLDHLDGSTSGVTGGFTFETP